MSQTFDTLMTPIGPVVTAEEDGIMKSLGYFALNHPARRRAFGDSSRGDILMALLGHVKNRTIKVVIDPSQHEPIGFIAYTVDESTRTLHVQHLLTTPKTSALLGIRTLWTHYHAGWNVTAMRRGKLKRYNYEDFINELK
jgi:hypothetical protein